MLTTIAQRSYSSILDAIPIIPMLAWKTVFDKLINSYYPLGINTLGEHVVYAIFLTVVTGIILAALQKVVDVAKTSTAIDIADTDEQD